MLKRIGFYLFGFSIGLVFLAFILKNKKTEFCYGVDCRILKNIRSKTLVYNKGSDATIKNHAIDSITINYILNNGDVDISNSNTKLDSCKIYVIKSEVNKKRYTLTIENCNKTATVKDVELN